MVKVKESLIHLADLKINVRTNMIIYGLIYQKPSKGLPLEGLVCCNLFNRTTCDAFNIVFLHKHEEESDWDGN